MPGLFESYLKKEGFEKKTNTLADYLAGLTTIATKYFAEDKTSAKILAKLNTDVTALALKLGIPYPANKEKTLITLGKKGEDWVAGAEKILNETLDAHFPPPERGPNLKPYASIAANVEFKGGKKLEGLADANVKTKIASIFAAGSSYKGHGPTTALGSGVLHCHVGNGDGIAFKWAGEKLEIYALGTKSDGAKPGNSGYSWQT